MFRYLRDPLFVFCCSLYVANRWFLKPRLAVGEHFFHGHFNDVLLIPCALPPLLYLHRHLSIRAHDGFPTGREVTLHLLVWTVYCECLGPIIQHAGIGDPLDAVAYFAGAIGSWLFWRRAATMAQGRRVTSHRAA